MTKYPKVSLDKEAPYHFEYFLNKDGRIIRVLEWTRRKRDS